MSASESDKNIRLDQPAIDQGYKICKSTCHSVFGQFKWLTVNLSKQKRQGINALGSFLVQCTDLLDLETADGLSLDVWQETHDDLERTLAGRPGTPLQAALFETVERFEIPSEYLFGMSSAADWWIRNRKCETFADTAHFARQVGGNMLAASACVLRVTGQSYREPALECGQAIHLTQMLANLVSDLKEQKSYLPKADYEGCGINTSRVKMRQNVPEFRHFVRQFTSPIEKLFHSGGQLTNHLDLDGVRSISSLIDYHWKVFTKIQSTPEIILKPGSVLTRQEKLKLGTRHLLGLEGKSPIVANSREH